MSKHVIDLRSGRAPRREMPRRSSSRPPESRPAPLRVRRRRARLAVVALVVVACGAVAYGVHYVSYLPRLNVGLINVIGAEALDASLVQSYVESQLHDGTNRFLSRGNIFLYPKAAIEKGITASFPRVKAAALSREGFSQTLNVQIQERKALAKWCAAADDCYAMDESGYVFAKESASSTTVFSEPYTFTGEMAEQPIGQTFIPGHMPGLLVLLRTIQQQAGFLPAGITVEDAQDITIHFAQGFDLKASFGQDAAALARNLQLVLSSQALQGKQDLLEYIDLRFGNRVYYKLKGEEQAQP